MIRVHLFISKNNFPNIQEQLHYSEEYVLEKAIPWKEEACEDRQW